MFFEEGHLYHVFNQGNKRQPIFFSRENYLYFLEKVREYIVPHVYVIAWCLMPNHFHLLVYVHDVDFSIDSRSWRSNSQLDKRTLNQSIGLALRSYTRAVNNQRVLTGSLFRQKTKAIDLIKPIGITPSFYNTDSGTLIHVDNPGKEYPQLCFNYIHENPVRANLVDSPDEWEFSSALDYAGKRKGTLINSRIAQDFGLKW